MIKNITLLFILLCSYAYSQVGINTKTPKSSLHVNGGLQITNELNVGGNASTVGNSGTDKYILISQGTDKPLKWVDAKELINNDLNPTTQILAGIATKTTSTSASSATTITYNISNKIDSDYVTYSNGYFTIKKSGLYDLKLLTYLRVTNGGGTVINRIRKSGGSDYFYKTNNFDSGVTSFGDSLGGVVYLNAGDVLYTTSSYTRSFTILSASLSIMYLGQSLD